MTTALGAIPQKRESVDASISNQTIQDLKTVRVAFFAGDDVGSIEKYEMPSVKGFGGLFLPHIKTLPKENKGMLYRCQLTPLKTAMIPQPYLMLAPGERDNWAKSFTQSNAIENPDGTWRDKVINGFTESNAAVIKETKEFATRSNDFQVYKERYPGHDIQEITRRSEPHGAGGVVEVTALKGATQAEIDAAQLFFFPDWPEIAAGTAFLPDTERELREYINGRIKTIGFECPIELRAQYMQIGQAMLKSCTEFRQAYLTTFQKNEIIMKDSAAKGNTGASYHPRTEDAMRMLEYRRKDDIVAGDSSSVDRLARIMEQKEIGDNALEMKRLELQERELHLREVEAGIRKPEPIAPVVSAPFVSTNVGPPVESVITTTYQEGDSVTVIDAVNFDTGTRICGQPKADQTPCQRTLKENETACFQHSGE